MTSGIVISDFFFFFGTCKFCVLLKWPVRCATVKHRGEAEKTAKFIILTGSGGRRNSMPNRTTWESLLGCQEAEDQEGGEIAGHNPCLGFHGESRTGLHEQPVG